jgi:hypothetical protein
MQNYTVWGLAAIVLLGIGAHWFTSKKKDLGKFAMGIGLVALVIAVATYSGGVQALSSGGTLNIGSAQEVPVASQEMKLYESIGVSTKIWGSNSYSTASGTIKIYPDGVDPTDSNTNPLDTITVSSGVGNTTDKVLRSATPYGIVFDGAATYYDQWYNGETSSILPYITTSTATISAITLDFYDIVTVATINDPINEAATTGVVNGQTSAENATSGGSNEIQIGSTGTSADDSILYYNKTNGDGQFYIDIDVGADGANKAIKDMVLVFSKDRSNPFEGNEFSSVTVQHRTGTEFGIPAEIKTYVNNADKISLGGMINGGTTGTYRITFNMDESLLTAGGDILFMNIDDMGDYQGTDLMKNTKATASDTITLAVVA